MLNKEIFSELLESYISFSKERHGIIRNSNDLLRLSKQIIFALHRGDFEKAEEMFKEAEERIEKLEEMRGNNSPQGAYRAALEEYLEAKFYYLYLKGETIGFLDNIPTIFYEEYLAGLCDFTGELVRRATLLVTDEKYDEIQKIRDLNEEIVESLLKFDLVSKLRAKFDDAKRNLKRLEEILYDIKIRKN